MIAKFLFQSVATLLAFALFLFVPAGRLDWPAAWVFLGFMAILSLISGSWLLKANPDLLAERMRSPVHANQPAADKKFMLGFLIVNMIWFIVMGLDERFHPSRMPFGLQALGLVILVASSAFILWVFRENSFAAAVVRVQSERGHRVVSSGPYAFVRHPMYSAAIFFMAGIALLLGSWWRLAISPIFALLFALRAVIEERTLTTGLPDYADYASRVRYRLFPGVW